MSVLKNLAIICGWLLLFGYNNSVKFVSAIILDTELVKTQAKYLDLRKDKGQWTRLT